MGANTTGLLTWYFVYASGVHATIAGVLLAFTVPVLTRDGEAIGLAENLEHRWRPVSAGLAMPLFALFATGVSLQGDQLSRALTDSVTLGVVAGLVLGKLVGIFGSTFALAKFNRAHLSTGLSWWDIVGVSLLAEIGFTVSLLIGELAYITGDPRSDFVKAAVLTGSLIAAALASGVLIARNQVYRRLERAERQHR